MKKLDNKNQEKEDELQHPTIADISCECCIEQPSLTSITTTRKDKEEDDFGPGQSKEEAIA